uniref:cyclin-dependent protein kinase inhibitor SMR6-like n=1 Tax=Erigeron canadensis TaxID=72917 RepID=UPI001CB96E33|nr:cyclin-dependent protein kinase inhibitor SMR6-like [Erigeron canadensis]
MGIVEETIMEKETTTKKWVISGIQFMTPLKPICTKKEIRKSHDKENEGQEHEEIEKQNEEKEEYESCKTPTTLESLIPVLKCPGAPRKRKAISRSHCNRVRDYFKPPDLESVFRRCVERA